MLNLVQSYVTLRVPLYVSYVFHSPVGAGGWQHFDLQSELRLTFVYDTAILWKDGIGSPPQAELQGAFRSSKSQLLSLDSSGVFLFVCCFFFPPSYRGVVPNQHAYQQTGTFGGQLPHPGPFQGSVCRVAFWRPSW